jgi:alpha-L-rhamnosidase
VGWCRLRVHGKAGDVITARYAEMLNEDGALYTANLRGAPATDRFVLNGEGEETLEWRNAP